MVVTRSVPRAGRHFLQIPGPSSIPDRVRAAIQMQVIDHRGPEFTKLAREVLNGCKPIFGCTGPVLIFPSSGTGAWEAALVNTLSPGDRVLISETGHFAKQWATVATRLGFKVECIETDWRRGADPQAIEAILAEDRCGQIKAVLVVHNETSTGATSQIAHVRKAMDRAGHPALLIVDAISSLGSINYQHDEWAVDVTVACSQKGLMLPPGLGLVAVSQKAIAASQVSRSARSYWDWSQMFEAYQKGSFPYTPATNLLFGLRESISMLLEEGLENVFERHVRLAAATRAAVVGWGMEVLCREPAEYSPVLTAVLMPEGCAADDFRSVALEQSDMSLGAGLGRLSNRVFRIGHLGECNELTLIGALGGIEMGLARAGVPHTAGGVLAAMSALLQDGRAGVPYSAAGRRTPHHETLLNS